MMVVEAGQQAAASGIDKDVCRGWGQVWGDFCNAVADDAQVGDAVTTEKLGIFDQGAFDRLILLGDLIAMELSARYWRHCPYLAR